MLQHVHSSRGACNNGLDTYSESFEMWPKVLFVRELFLKAFGQALMVLGYLSEEGIRWDSKIQ